MVNGNSMMVYNFATVSLGSGVAFSASGSNALALIGAGNMYIGDSIDLSGRSGANGSDGTGHVGGGAGGGGGGGGAIILATDSGQITFAGALSIRAGAPGNAGSDNLTGNDGGGQGGAGGAAGVGGGSGGIGGRSVAGGEGGRGGKAAQNANAAGGGGGGGGGVRKGTGGKGGDGSLNGGQFGQDGSNAGTGDLDGGSGGDGGLQGQGNQGGDGGGGGLLGNAPGNRGSRGSDGQGQGSGGGGGGGGADGLRRGQQGKGGDGGNGKGGGMDGQKGQRGGFLGAAGAGGGGAFIVAAPGGVVFTGTGLMGDGEGAVYGQFTNTGTWPDGDPGVGSWADFDPINAYVSSGGGGGGAGGDGQLLLSGSGINVSATEGTAFSGTVANFYDPAPPTPVSESATIDWGDGTQSTASTGDGSIASDGNGGWNVKGTHTYTEEGSYTITIVATPTGDPNSALTMTSTATVVDAYISATGQNEGATVGVPFSGVVATITDSNPFATVSDFSATIYWPDNGTTSPGTISAGSGGAFLVSGTHTFALPGSWQVRVSVQDDGGAGASAVSVFTVSGGYGGGGATMVTALSPTSAPMTAPADSAVVFASLPIVVTPSGVALLLPVVPPDASNLPAAPADAAAPSGTPPAAALPGDGAVSDAMALALAGVRDTSSGLPDGLDAGGDLLADLGAPLLPAGDGLA